MYHQLVFLVSAGQVHTDLDMAALDLVVHGLAQVVEQTGPLGGGHVRAQLRGQQPGDVGHLDGVVQHVLAVAGAVVHPTQQLHFLRVQVVDVGLQHGALALGPDDLLHLPFRLLHHLLDAGGVDTAVGDQALQGDAGDFPADGVVAGDGDGLRRVVDDEFRSGEGFQSANVAAFPADDAPLHLVVGERNDGHGHLAGVICRAALNGGGNHLTGDVVCLLFIAVSIKLWVYCKRRSMWGKKKYYSA